MLRDPGGDDEQLDYTALRDADLVDPTLAESSNTKFVTI